MGENTMGFMKKRLSYASMVAVALLSGLMAGCGSDSTPATAPVTTTTFLYTSDAHYGIKRQGAAIFNGYSNAQQVNAAMVTVMNTMPTVTLPADGGLNAGAQIGKVDFVIQSGDIANRSQANQTGYTQVQSAKASLTQFLADYGTLKYPLYLVPGNHDVSNAIGYTKALTPASDWSVLAYIYNTFVKTNTFSDLVAGTLTGQSAPATPGANYVAANKVYYSRDIGGVHFMFINMWPDSDAQAWMDADLAKISSTTPAIIVTHDQPETEGKHLSDPTSTPSALVFGSKFENLLVNTATFGAVLPLTDQNSPQFTASAERLFVNFLQRHKNIVAYFHGNDNYNQINTCDPVTGVDTSPTNQLSPVYTYTAGSITATTFVPGGRGCYKGPDPVTNPVYLPEFRVDSPMKGAVSGLADATVVGQTTDKISYQVVTIDAIKNQMTVREYFWKPGATAKWGASATISLAPRTK
jgi:hypothetical protein